MMTTMRKTRKTPPSQVLPMARAQSTAITTVVTVTLISIWIIWCAKWMTAMMTSPQRSLLRVHKQN